MAEWIARTTERQQQREVVVELGRVEAPDRWAAEDEARARFRVAAVSVQSVLSARAADEEAALTARRLERLKDPALRAGWAAKCACGQGIRRGVDGVVPTECTGCRRRAVRDV